MKYIWDKELNLFRRTHVEAFIYSDGAEVEQRLYDIIRNASDRSTFSSELVKGIADWPSEYHLSRARHCLIRPLGIKPGEKVLELGCGCGAITRYLGEIGAEVIAVEGSIARARIAAERCRDLSNVKVYVDDLLRFEIDERFEWILLVGVLEYAPVFSGEKEPVQHYLRTVARFLAPNGKLVIAIENKLGLKYFNGCSEDHVGIPFYGVQNLYGAKTPRTFGRRELLEQLSAAGFLHCYFYYPFPDYKLPSVILSDDALKDQQFDAVDLIIRSHARDYSGSPYRLFDEALAFSTLSANGLFAEFSNSFLVVATLPEAIPHKADRLAMTFAVNRVPEFLVVTSFYRSDDVIRVVKEPVFPDFPRERQFQDFNLLNVPSVAIYNPGRQLLWRLLSVRANKGTLDQVVTELRPWIIYLFQFAANGGSHETFMIDADKWHNLRNWYVPGIYLDCTPFNLLETRQGLVFIDNEWQADCDVPLGWVITRGLLHSLSVGLAPENSIKSIADVVQELCRSVELYTTETEVADWINMEARFLSLVTGQALSDILILLKNSTSGLIYFSQAVAERDGQIASLNQAVAERDGQIASLSQAVAEREEQIANLNQAIAERDRRIINLNQMLADKDLQMTSLSQAIADKEKIEREIRIIKNSKRYRYAERAAIISWYFTRPNQLFLHIKTSLLNMLRSRLSTRTKRFIKKYILFRKEPAWKVPSLPANSVVLDNDHLVVEKENTDKYDVIVLPVIDWDFRFQRPQQLSLEFAKHGHRVFYLNTKFSQLETNLIQKKAPNVYEVQLPGNPEVNLYADNIDGFLLQQLENAMDRLIDEYNISYAVVIVHLPFWKEIAFLLREKYNFKIVYDCMDKHSGFSTNSECMLEKERDLTASSDLVVTTSHLLYDEHSKVNNKCVLVQNATDFTHFSAPLTGIPPVMNQYKKPIIGYYGAISDWFDMQIVIDMAQNRPDWTFVLIGSTFGADVELVKNIKNIHLLGEIPYRLLPGYLHSFDVAIIPFKLLPLTLATNPVKFFEYLSAGKPVVSVPLPELLPYEPEGLLSIAYNSDDFVKKIEIALNENDVSKIAKRVHFAQQHTWEARYLQLRNEIKEAHSKASIIIVTYNNVHLTKLCLESIYQKTNYPNFEVIIVDNNSSDGTREYLQGIRQKHDNIKIIYNDFNAGFAKANNQGIGVSEGEYIILLNNDTVVTDGWLARLIYYLDRYPEVGMVGPVTNITGNEAKIDVTYSSIDEIDAFAAQNARDYRGCYFEIKMLSMFCVAFRRGLFDEIGPLDERFGIGMFEDDDYSLRVKQKGYKLICVEDVFIHHFHSASFKLVDQKEYLQMFEKNRKKFEEKWGIRWEPHCYREKRMEKKSNIK